MFRQAYLALFTVTVALVGGYALYGCSDECLSAQDCLSNEVCYAGVCTPALENDTVCTSDLDCAPLSCIGGTCVPDSTTAPPLPCATPLCFDRGMIMPGQLQTMTATTGTDPDDQEAAMTSVVAVNQPGNNIVYVIGRNATTDRYICLSLNTTAGTCERMQVALSDPSVGTPVIYETRSCTVGMLTSNINSVIGDVTGFVQDCQGDIFEAYANFEVTRQ